VISFASVMTTRVRNRLAFAIQLILRNRLNPSIGKRSIIRKLSRWRITKRGCRDTDPGKATGRRINVVEMKTYGQIIPLVGVLLLGIGCAHQVLFLSIQEPELIAYREQAVAVLNTPTNWTAQGAWQIPAQQCRRMPQQPIFYDFSVGLGDKLGLPPPFASGPCVTVCIPVTTAHPVGEEDYVGVTFHLRTHKLIHVGVWGIGKRRSPQQQGGGYSPPAAQSAQPTP
jgi:hypothetical protein